jgi:REP element-mobilizing transposase RayT
MTTHFNYGSYYHVYNRGIDSCPIFLNREDYEYFLRLYKTFVCPVADTLAWCLIRNHIHFFIRIKDLSEIGYLNPHNAKSEIVYLKWRVYDFAVDPNKAIKPVPYRQWMHLFSTYAKWFNRKYSRTGSLFEKSFKRKEVTGEKDFIRLIRYINNNPFTHRIVNKSEDYHWSSYSRVLSFQDDIVSHRFLHDYFRDMENFVTIHRNGIFQ